MVANLQNILERNTNGSIGLLLQNVYDSYHDTHKFMKTITTLGSSKQLSGTIHVRALLLFQLRIRVKNQHVYPLATTS